MRDEMRDETTIAAEEERPEPVGTVPSTKSLREGIVGLQLYFV